MLNQNTPTNNTAADSCACRCFSPNGIVATITVNILLWIAVMCSGGAVLDCHVVTARVSHPDWPALPDNLIGLTDATPTERRGFGFFIHEDHDGHCRWEYWGNKVDDSEDKWTSEDDKELEDYFTEYFDWMGSDWRYAAKLAASTLMLGALLAVAAGVYFCVAHVRPIRFVMAALTLIVMALQFAVLAARDSDFCQDRECELGRSSHFAIAGGILYLVAAPFFVVMKNYPGVRAENDTNEAAPVAKVVSPASPWAMEEATHADDAVTVDYGLEEVPVSNDVHDVEDPPQAEDGLSDAQEIKAAQIY